ncbi:hypothetical protein Tco_0832563 [Tanacetum coccineum]
MDECINEVYGKMEQPTLSKTRRGCINTTMEAGHGLSMESQIDTERGPGKNKRKWNDVEDEKLVEAMVDMLNSRSHFKSDNGFKHGS